MTHLADFNKVTRGCRFCPMCRHACTVGNITCNELNMPRGKGLLGYAVMEGLMPLEGRTAEAFYECCQCGLCEEWCVTHYNLPGAILAARADAVEQGSQPEVVKEVVEGVISRGSLYQTEGRDRTEQFADSAPVGLELASVALFMGCGAAFADRPSAEATLKALNESQVGYSLLEDEKCCGAPLYSLGYRDKAKALAKTNLANLREVGCKILVSACPECVKTFRNDYPLWGLEETGSFKVYHISEYVLKLIDEGVLKLNKPVNLNLTYHDNCHMSRGLGVCKEPRDLLTRIEGVELKELEYTHAHSHCCGASGGNQLVNPETAKIASRKLIEEASSLGVEAIVTASVNCKHHLQSAKSDGDDIEILHIMEVVSRAL